MMDLHRDRDHGLQLYLREISQIPLLTPAEEVELAARIQRGDRKARAKMITANLRLVVRIAHDYTNCGLPLLDLVSEGNIGLMKAVDRFDPQKGGKLSTYAAWWIKQSIKRALANQSKTIRLPVHLVDTLSKMSRACLALSERLGRDPSDAELADRLGLPRAKVAHLRTVSVRPASLDSPVGTEEVTVLGEIIGDDNMATPFELFRDKTLADEVRAALRILDPREARVLTLRFGLDGAKPKTLETVGQQFRVTRERIRQIQNIALAKLHGMLQHRRTAGAVPRPNYPLVSPALLES